MGVLCADKVLDLPFSLAWLLDGGTEIAHAEVTISAPAFYASFEASVTLRVKYGHEVHVNVQSSLRSTGTWFSSVPDAVSVYASLEARVMDVRREFSAHGAVDTVLTKVAVDEVNGVEWPNNLNARWWMGDGRVGDRLQVFVSLGTPDWLVCRIPRLNSNTDNSFLRPAAIIMEDVMKGFDFRSMIAVRGSLRCPGAYIAPVDVVVEPDTAKGRPTRLNVELRKNPAANLGGNILDALEGAVCHSSIGNDPPVLQGLSTLTFSDSTDLNSIRRAIDVFALKYLVNALYKASPKVSLEAGPTSSSGVDVWFNVVSEQLWSSVRHTLSVTVNKAGIKNIIRNLPAALLNGDDISLTARTVGGSVFQLVKYHGAGAAASAWYSPQGVPAAGQARARMDVYVVVATAACSCTAILTNRCCVCHAHNRGGAAGSTRCLAR